MKKVFAAGLACSAVLLSACDFSKKKTETAQDEKTQDWSCSAPANVEQIQSYLKEDFLKQLDQRVRHSGFEADQDLLNKISKSIKFEISHISTKTENPQNAKALDCTSQIQALLPKGLQKRAENAFLAQPCEECEGEAPDASENNYTLQDQIRDQWPSLKLKDDRIEGINFNYHLERSDQDEISLTAESHSAVNFAASISEMAVNFASYEQRSKENQNAEQAYVDEYNKENAAQMALAQKALDVRQKELDTDQKAAVERLNAAWDRFSPEQKESVQQDQSDWFEKRDVDCKVLSQKNVNQLEDRELETYQKQRGYWDNAMYKQNQAIQYSKCFIQKTKERTVYLNNVFN